MVQKSQLCLNRIIDTYEHIILPPDNTVSELGGVKRLEIHRDDMKLTEPEDIDPGPNVKVFDQMVSILGIEFHISPGTIERLNRGPPHGLPHGHGPMGGFFRCMGNDCKNRDNSTGRNQLESGHLQTSVQKA